MATIGESAGAESPFSELVRLQMDFQTKLAEETLRYMRRIQASALPATPSTVVRAEANRAAQRCAPGDSVTVVERVHNRQRVHAIVTAALTALVAGNGTTWFARTEPATLIVPPEDHADLELRLDVPAELPPGTYRGALVLAGLEGAVPVAIEVAAPKRARRKVSRRKAARRKVSRGKKSARK